jgi:hypothetical protein
MNKQDYETSHAKALNDYYTHVLKNILKTCEKHKSLFDDRFSLEIYYTYSGSDNSDHLEIRRFGNNLGYCFDSDYHASIDEVIKRWGAFLTPEELAKNFAVALQKSLGEHIAKKETSQLEKELLN